MAVITEKVRVFKCKCERCGHEWTAKEKPLRCAGCKSPYWDRPKNDK